MYTCTICHSINHPSRVHCQNCGTIPAKYSMFGIARNSLTMRETVVAIGARRAGEHVQKLKLRTVTLDYYAEV